ncbi:MAG: acyl carrier protein [Bacillota bacterium]|nr:acyl carrier protein [Bacillota bacterium]
MNGEEERIKEIMLEQLAIDESLLSRDLTLDALAIDSLDALELIVALEEEFDIELDEELFGDCENIGQISDLIISKIKED